MPGGRLPELFCAV